MRSGHRRPNAHGPCRSEIECPRFRQIRLFPMMLGASAAKTRCDGAASLQPSCYYFEVSVYDRSKIKLCLPNAGSRALLPFLSFLGPSRKTAHELIVIYNKMQIILHVQFAGPLARGVLDLGKRSLSFCVCYPLTPQWTSGSRMTRPDGGNGLRWATLQITETITWL